jgi:hypothetical protein
VDKDNSVIGIYNSVERPAVRTLNGDGTSTPSGDLIQVSRLGNPLVNEVVIPLKDKDKFNATKPTGDGAFLPYVLKPELAGLLTALYGIPTPPPDRNDLVAVFLTGIPGLNQPAGSGQVPCEMLRLNMAIAPTKDPSRLGILKGDNAGIPQRAAPVRRRGRHRRARGGWSDRVHAEVQRGAEQPARRRDQRERPSVPAVLPVRSAAAQSIRSRPSPGAARALPQNKGDYGRQAGKYGARPAGAEGSGDELYEDAHANEEEADVEATNSTVPQADGQLKLQGANPSSISRLEFDLPAPARVSLKIYDLQGRAVRTLIDQTPTPGPSPPVGRPNGRWRDGGKGIYFARLVAGSIRSEKKIVIQ